MSPRSRIAVAVLLVAAAGPAGFFAYRFLAAAHLIAPPGAPAGRVLDASRLPGILARSETAAAVAPSAQAGAPASAGESAQKPIPTVLPDITLPDAQGRTRKLSAWIGHPLIVNFWATWCEPCRREIPLLETLRHRSTDHLEVVGIAVDDRGPVLQYMHRLGVDYPVLIGGSEGGLAAINAFGMEAVLPFSVFADTHGRIVAVKVGELHPDDAKLILARLADVDAGRLPLQQARDQISSGLATLAAARARASTPAAAPSPAKSPSAKT